MDALKKTQEDLQKGQQKLDDMLARLDKEQVLFFRIIHGMFVVLWNGLIFETKFCNFYWLTNNLNTKFHQILITKKT